MHKLPKPLLPSVFVRFIHGAKSNHSVQLPTVHQVKSNIIDQSANFLRASARLSSDSAGCSLCLRSWAQQPPWTCSWSVPRWPYALGLGLPPRVVGPWLRCWLGILEPISLFNQCVSFPIPPILK